MAIGLRERISTPVVEKVVFSVLDGTLTQEYIDELVALETSGKSRADNLNRTIRRVAVNNPLIKILKEHEEDFRACVNSAANRCIMYVSLYCCSYELFYDLVTLLGKYFHVQEKVSTELVKSKLCQKYGNGENVSRGICCALGMLVDAGLITRKKQGEYQANRQQNVSDFGRWVYKKSFLHNNPNLTESDNVETNPFFEFIR